MSATQDGVRQTSVVNADPSNVMSVCVISNIELICLFFNIIVTVTYVVALRG
jgi:hypothetical protein